MRGQPTENTIKNMRDILLQSSQSMNSLTSSQLALNQQDLQLGSPATTTHDFQKTMLL